MTDPHPPWLAAPHPCTSPVQVAPNAAVREILSAWDVAQTEVLIAQNQARLAGQWVPAPPDPADMPIGEPGYSLQIPMKRLSDALDSIMRDSDRYTLCVDLSGKASSEQRVACRKQSTSTVSTTALIWQSLAMPLCREHSLIDTTHPACACACSTPHLPPAVPLTRPPPSTGDDLLHVSGRQPGVCLPA